MSDSNRGERTEAVGPVFAIVAAILLVAVIVGVLSYSQGVESERRNNAPAAYAEAAKEHADRACRESEATTVFECVYEIVESSQQQAQAEQDLDAQQGMQFWAAVMAAMAAGSLLLTGMTVLLIKQTLDATADMLGEAKELTQETIKATNAMINANEIALQAQRPWLLLDTLKYEPRAESGQWDLALVLKNFGISPARDAIIKTAWQITTEPGEAIPHEIQMWPVAEMTGIVGPGAPVLSYHITLTESQILNQWISIICKAEYTGADGDKPLSTQFRIVAKAVHASDGQFALRWHPVGKMQAT